MHCLLKLACIAAFNNILYVIFTVAIRRISDAVATVTYETWLKL